MFFWENGFGVMCMRDVVDSKFGCKWGVCCCNEPFGSYGGGGLKNIRRGWEMFCSHTRFDVGDGTNVRFWHDLWCRDKPFALDYKFIGYFIAAHLEFSGNSNKWDVSFFRAAHDCEVDAFALFFNLLYSIRVRQDGEH
jgi:hypothetical protein